MNIQNLREKFNQPSNGSLSSPGTSYGAIKSKVNSENLIAKNQVQNLKPTPFVARVEDNKSNLQFNSHLRNSKSPSPDILFNNVKIYTNDETEIKKIHRSPEQSQQDIILRKWSRNSIGAENDSNNNQNIKVEPMIKSKNCVSRYIAHLSTAENSKTDNTTDNNLSERTEKLKSIYESNTNINPDKYDNNVNTSAMNVPVRKNNVNFLNNSTKPKMYSEFNSYNAIKDNNSLSNGVKMSEVNERWKTTNEEPEFKKINLSKVSTVSPSSKQDYSNLEKKYKTLQKEHEDIKHQLKEKSDQLVQLRKISEAMYKEYDQLQNQYKLETNTMHQAIERASQWYKQNRELKRRSSALMQHVISVKPDCFSEMKDEVDAFSTENDNEMEELRKTIKELTTDISKIQAELNSIKLQEFEAQEQIVELTNQLVSERRNRITAETKLKENVNNSVISDKCEGLELSIETELLLAIQRAERAESEKAMLLNKISDLEEEIVQLKNANKSIEILAPPPPPPPPPLVNLSNTNKVRKHISKSEHIESSAADQMADLLGIPKKPALKVQGGAIDDIINEIKGGRFTLKATEKMNSTKKEEPPPVVHEMINILGTLRRPPKKKETVLPTISPE